MPTNRRTFIKLSTSSALALSTMSTGVWLSGCAKSETAPGMRFLRPGDVEMLNVFVPSVLAGQIGPGETEKIAVVVQSFDRLLGGTSQLVVDLTMQAFDVLSFAPTRGLMTGQWSNWAGASVGDADKALGRLRDSNLNLLNAIYAALIRLIASSYYLIPSNQLATGYPGPPKKVAGEIPAVDEPTNSEAAP